jgi:hypothetical protein
VLEENFAIQMLHGKQGLELSDTLGIFLCSIEKDFTKFALGILCFY